MMTQTDLEWWILSQWFSNWALESSGRLVIIRDGSPIPRVSHSAGLGWGPRICISNKLPVKLLLESSNLVKAVLLRSGFEVFFLLSSLLQEARISLMVKKNMKIFKDLHVKAQRSTECWTNVGGYYQALGKGRMERCMPARHAGWGLGWGLESHHWNLT